MCNCLFRALGWKANRHVFVFHLTNKQKRHVLFTFKKKIHKRKLSSCSWRKINFSFFLRKKPLSLFLDFCPGYLIFFFVAPTNIVYAFLRFYCLFTGNQRQVSRVDSGVKDPSLSPSLSLSLL